MVLIDCVMNKVHSFIYFHSCTLKVRGEECSDCALLFIYFNCDASLAVIIIGARRQPMFIYSYQTSITTVYSIMRFYIFDVSDNLRAVASPNLARQVSLALSG